MIKGSIDAIDKDTLLPPLITHHTHHHDCCKVPALAKRRVGSLTGTTGLLGHITWFFLWTKKSMKVDLILAAGHSIDALVTSLLTIGLVCCCCNWSSIESKLRLLWWSFWSIDSNCSRMLSTDMISYTGICVYLLFNQQLLRLSTSNYV